MTMNQTASSFASFPLRRAGEVAGVRDGVADFQQKARLSEQALS